MKKDILFIVYSLLFTVCGYAQTAPGIQWQKCFGGTDSEVAKSIKQTNDGGYIVTGYTSSHDGDVNGAHNTNGSYDYWVIKLDNIGNLQWQKCLGGSGWDESFSIIQTTDSGYMVVGGASSTDGDLIGNLDSLHISYWMVKLSTTGNLQWEKLMGGSNNDEAYDVKQTTDGGYILTGYSGSNDSVVSGNHGWNDYWVVKTDSVGVIQWQNCYGGNYNDYAASIDLCSDGGYVIAGSTESNNGNVINFHGNVDYWIVKINPFGILQWQKCLGGTNADLGYAMLETSDKGFIFSGGSLSTDFDITGNHGGYDYWVVKLDSLANLQWEKSLGGTAWDISTSIFQTSDSGYIVAGYTPSIDGDVTFNNGGNDYWIIKLDNNGNLKWQKCLGGTGVDEAYSVIQTSDGGYAIAGIAISNDVDVTGNHGGGDYWIVKLGPDTITGVNNITTNISFNIYPNPFSEELAIHGKDASTPLSVTLFDVFGKEIISQVFTTTNCKLQTVNLSPGVYFVKVNNEIKKVVKIK